MTQAIIKKENTNALTEAVISSENANRPQTDIFHTPTAYIFEIELPGVTQENIALEITEKNVLVLKAQNTLIAPSSAKVVLSQIRSGHYYRAFELNEHIDRDSITAKLELGILTVTVSKQEKAQPKRITVST